MDPEIKILSSYSFLFDFLMWNTKENVLKNVPGVCFPYNMSYYIIISTLYKIRGTIALTNIQY